MGAGEDGAYVGDKSTYDEGVGANDEGASDEGTKVGSNDGEMVGSYEGERVGSRLKSSPSSPDEGEKVGA